MPSGDQPPTPTSRSGRSATKNAPSSAQQLVPVLPAEARPRLDLGAGCRWPRPRSGSTPPASRRPCRDRPRPPGGSRPTASFAPSGPAPGASARSAGEPRHRQAAHADVHREQAAAVRRLDEVVRGHADRRRGHVEVGGRARRTRRSWAGAPACRAPGRSGRRARSGSAASRPSARSRRSPRHRRTGRPARRHRPGCGEDPLVGDRAQIRGRSRRPRSSDAANRCSTSAGRPGSSRGRSRGARRAARRGPRDRDPAGTACRCTRPRHRPWCRRTAGRAGRTCRR